MPNEESALQCKKSMRTYAEKGMGWSAGLYVLFSLIRNLKWNFYPKNRLHEECITDSLYVVAIHICWNNDA